jgi:hypothetical protein
MAQFTEEREYCSVPDLDGKDGRLWLGAHLCAEARFYGQETWMEKWLVHSMDEDGFWTEWRFSTPGSSGTGDLIGFCPFCGAKLDTEEF